MLTPLKPRAASLRRPRYRSRPEHYYVGRRPQGTEVYVVSAAGAEPLEHYGYRSHTAFDWGAPTAGALELGYALLAHGTERRPPDQICVTFWTDVVASLDRPGFVLGHGEIALWLLSAFCPGDEPGIESRPSLRARVARHLPWWIR